MAHKMVLKDIIDSFFDGYKKKNSISPKWGKKEGELLNRLIKYCSAESITQENLIGCIDWYFSLDSDFESKVKWDFSNLCAQFNKYYLSYIDERNRAKNKIKLTKARENAYSRQQIETDRKLTINHKTPEQMSQFYKEKCPELTIEQLKKEIRINTAMPIPRSVRGKMARAMAIAWGKDTYVKVWNEMNKPKDHTDRKKLLEKQKNMLTGSQERHKRDV